MKPLQTSPFMPEADWRLMRAFVAVMRAGNLTRAAAALGATQPTVGRQIRDLELLPALFPELMAKIPEADFEMIATEEVENLMRRDADIAIRFVQPTQGDLLAQPVGKVVMGLYASQDYIARCGRAETPADLVDHIFISNRSGDDVRQGAAALGLDPKAMRLSARSDLAVFRNSAVRAGIGICACHTWWADLQPDLVRVLPGTDVVSLPIWLVAHEDMRRSLTQRRVFDFLRDRLKARFACVLTGKIDPLTGATGV